MRLIDADKFAAEFYHMPELVYTDAIARCIEMQPTVDAVQVVQGHWVERFTGNEYIVFCSNCNYEATEMVDYHLEYDYCPYCGAKMDGDSDAND